MMWSSEWGKVFPPLPISSDFFREHCGERRAKSFQARAKLLHAFSFVRQFFGSQTDEAPFRLLDGFFFSEKQPKPDLIALWGITSLPLDRTSTTSDDTRRARNSIRRKPKWVENVRWEEMSFFQHTPSDCVRRPRRNSTEKRIFPPSTHEGGKKVF